MHSSTVRTCLCCPTETSRPDRRTATAGLRSFLHVDTGHLSSTTTGMSTSLTPERKKHGETSAIPAYKDVSAHRCARHCPRAPEPRRDKRNPCPFSRIRTRTRTAVNTSTRTTKTSTILAHIDVSAHQRARLQHTRKRKNPEVISQ